MAKNKSKSVARVEVKKEGTAVDNLRRLIIKSLKELSSLTFDLASLPLMVRYKGSRGMSLNRLINYLRVQGEIKPVNKNCYRLTDRGIAKNLPRIRRKLTKDGKIRILVFDIPEKEKRRRDYFRRHLRLLGFKPFQKSVWVSYENCEDWIERLVNYHRVGDWVALYVGKHIW